MRKTVLTLAALALVASPAFAGKFNKKISVGDKAPNFSGVPAVMKDQDTSLSLNDIKDDVVVIVFLANHCPVVTAYEDRVIEFANAYKDKGVKVVGVAVSGSRTRSQDDLPMIKKRVSEKGYSFAYGFDESQDVGRAYGATNTPQFVVLDKDRTVRYLGAMDDSQTEAKVTKTYLKDAVDALLAGKEITVSETRPQGCGIQYDKK
jgi:thiol-disulfide isomerase/thioredoxin